MRRSQLVELTESTLVPQSGTGQQFFELVVVEHGPGSGRCAAIMPGADDRNNACIQIPP